MGEPSIDTLHDTYEEQLSAARYKAERDAARQELQAMRERNIELWMESGMANELVTCAEQKAERLGKLVWRLQNRLARSHRRERNLRKGMREWRDKVMGAPVRTVSAYDLLSEEDLQTLRWVREHGGLDAVKRRWECLSYYADPVPRSCMEKRLARLQRQIDESHAALRRRNQRIAVLESEINRAHNENRMEFMRRAGNYTAFADEVCKRLAPELRYVEGCSKNVMDAALEALDRRLMPAGMQWPTVDGKPVDFVTGYEPSLGVLEAVSIYSNGACEVMSHDGIIKPVSEIHVVVLAADGEPLEVGKYGFSYVRPSSLTHTKPEPTDSWERIEDDATLEAAAYCDRMGIDVEEGHSFVEPMACDLVRRCKELARKENNNE